MQFEPGNLVQARDRVWVVQSDSTDDWLLLRPLGGADDEITGLIPALENKPVSLATFEMPDPAKAGSFNSARLLYDALRFQLRSSSGPFRCFGSINFEPRSYQFVPLLMAMRQNVVRLLIADDVGVGKTIESGLILRELIDRGEVKRFAVLCPPHLVDQWCDELEHHFNLKATALKASTSKVLENSVPHGHTLTEFYPHLVVSLDYIKSDRHRDYFQNMPLDLLLIDEAHTCVRSSGGNKQKRFDLVQKVTQDPKRHVLLLTATPHSGNEDAFFNLLSLLDERFLALKDDTSAHSKLRQDLSNYFVQRRRQDIKEWKVDAKERLTGFPIRMVSDLSYDLDPDWKEFFEQVQDYCAEFILQNEVRGVLDIQSAAIYEVIALFRCAASSPAAAEQTLKGRLEQVQEQIAKVQGGKFESDLGSKWSTTELGQIAAQQDLEALHEDLGFSSKAMFNQELSDDELMELSDQEPSLLLDNTKALEALIKLSGSLQGSNRDPKLKKVVDLVKTLLDEGFQPVIFCRFISTAKYVADCLKEVLVPLYEDKAKQASKGKGRGKKAATDAQADSIAPDSLVVTSLERADDVPTLRVECVTGELVPEDRKARVEDLMRSPQRVLVATDCLSEGINLQQGFTAVVHYDLAWNPTRHEQREGRVDRFGQTEPEVRCVMVYCEDNPIDQLVLNVIQKKSKNIQRALGVTVPVPQQSSFIEKSIILSMLTGRNTASARARQSSFLQEIEAQGMLEAPAPLGKYDVMAAPDRYIESLNLLWEDALDKANKQRTIFAQTRIHPEDIAPIWQEQQRILGSFNDVLDFAKQGCAAFGCNLRDFAPQQRKAVAKSRLKLTWQNNSGIDEAATTTTTTTQSSQVNEQKFYLPLWDINDKSLQQSFLDEGFRHNEILDFGQMYRASPFVSILSASVVNQAMSGHNEALSRCAVASIPQVETFTAIYLLRVRYQMRLTYNQKLCRHMMVEEIVPLMAQGAKHPEWDSSPKVHKLLLEASVQGNFPLQAAQRYLNTALELIKAHPEQRELIAQQRAKALQHEHESIKQYTSSDGHVTQVTPCQPVDVMGMYVLMPVLD